MVDELQAGAVVKSFTYGHDLISQRIVGGSLSFYQYDGHGSVRRLTDAAATITDAYDYDAFGNLIYSSGSTPNEYLFVGEQFDPNLGFHYLRARYLNQRNGRFWTMDFFEGDEKDPRSLHKYVYSYGNPVMHADPSGLMPTPYSRVFAAAVEVKIAEIYTRDHPLTPNVFFGRRAGIGGNPLLKPDILNFDLKTYMEIKPLSISGVAHGKAQMWAYFFSLGVVAGFEPEYSWLPSENVIYPLGTPTVFFNAEGLLFYRDEQEIFSEALAATTIAAAVNLLNILKGSGTVSELGRIGRLAGQALRASGYNLQTRMAVAEATGGRF